MLAPAMAGAILQLQESVKEDVAIVVEFAKEQKIFGSQPATGGDREVYVATKAEGKFKAKLDYKGVAGNLFDLDVTKWAVRGQSIPRHAAKAYGDKYVIPAARSQDYLKMLKHPVGVAVVGGSSPGAVGTWRRISLDLQTFGFMVPFADLLRSQKPWDDPTKLLIEQFKKACLHCPMDFYYFEASADLESRIFKKSFEMMEEYRKTEEQHAPGGWQVCCLFSAARDLQAQQCRQADGLVAAPSQTAPSQPVPSPKKGGSGAGGTQDDAQHVCKFFAGVEFAQTSEYKNLDKKLSKDCLLVHERMVAAGVARMLSGSWSKLGPKNSLDGLHKLIQISQRVAASGTQSELPNLMRFVVAYIYVRMLAGTLDTHVGIRPLRQWLTVPLLIFKLLQYVQTEFKYTKTVEINYLKRFADPEAWYRSFGSQPGYQHTIPLP